MKSLFIKEKLMLNRSEKLYYEAEQKIRDFPSEWFTFCKKYDIIHPTKNDEVDFLMWIKYGEQSA
jgi:hypothetical protein